MKFHEVRSRRPTSSAASLSSDGRGVPLYSEWVEHVEVSSESTPADWFSASLGEPWRDGSVGIAAIIPSGFEAYVRIDHATADERDEVHEGGLPHPAARRLVRVLASATASPDSCRMAVWNGWGDMPAAPEVIHLPGRDYVLLSGAVNAAAEPLWSHGGSTSHYQSPSLWWPDDRAWCVATEVDFAWTYVAGSESVAAALCGDKHLRTRRVYLEDDANA